MFFIEVMHFLELGITSIFMPSCILLAVAISAVLLCLAYKKLWAKPPIPQSALPKGFSKELSSALAPPTAASQSQNYIQPLATAAPRQEIAIDARLLKKGREGWFEPNDLFWCLRYLSIHNDKLLLVNAVDRHPGFRQYRTYTIYKKQSCVQLKQEIESDFVYYAANKKILGNKTIFAYPVSLLGNHWTLVLIDREERSLEYYDSRHEYPDNYIDASGKEQRMDIQDINRFFNALAIDITKQDPGLSGSKPYKYIQKIHQFLAQNNDDCGPWVSYCLEKRLKDPLFDAHALPNPDMQTYMAAYRLELAQRFVGIPEYCAQRQRRTEMNESIRRCEGFKA